MGLTRPRAYQIFDIDYKQSVRVVTVSNVTLGGGAPSQVDGVSLSLNDRVLVTAQNTGSQNGLYYVTTVGTGSNGTWARSVDGNETGEIDAGMIVMVTEGTTYADTQWKLTTNDPIVIGTTALTFVQNYSANSISSGTSNVVVNSNANVTVSAAGTANVLTVTSSGANIAGTIGATGIVSGLELSSTQSSGDEGGQVNLSIPATNTSLTGQVTIDIWQNKLRFFQGDSAKGAYIDLTAASAGVGTNLLAGGGTPGGSNTYVQFNDGGSFGGNGQFVYDKVTNIVTAGAFAANTNGTGQNFKVGDDAWLGDVNASDTVALIGQQNAANGYIVFGNADSSSKLGRAGSGPLTYAGAFTATGNVAGGNVTTGGNVVATGNVSGGNVAATTTVYSFGTITGVGNVTGGNLITAGLASVTGNLTTASAVNFNLPNSSSTDVTIASGLATAFKTRIGTTATNQYSWRTNLYYDGAAWQKDDATRGAWRLNQVCLTGNANSVMQFTYAPIGSTDVSELMTLTGEGLLTVSGNITGGNLTTGAQVVATGNITGGNVNTAGKVTASTLQSNVATGTAPLTVTSTTRVSNLNVAYAGSADYVGAGSALNGNFYVTLQSSLSSNVQALGNAAFIANASTGSFYATTYYGSGAGLTSITGANVSGTVANATYATSAGSATSATTAGTVTTAAQPNITSVGTLSSLTVTANVTGGNLVTGAQVVATGNITGGNISTAGKIVSTIVTGTAPFTVASTTKVDNLNVDYIDGMHAVSTNTATSVVARDASGNFAAGTITATLSGAATSATTAGTVTTAAQPNITSVGTLSSLAVTANVTGGNLVTAGQVSATGNITGGNIIANGRPLTSLNATNIDTGTLAQARLANSTLTLGSTTLTLGATTTTITGLSSVTSTTFVGALTGAATSATTAGTVTTAAQPNITSVGTLSSLTVTANVAGGNITTAGQVVATGNITGGNLITAGLVSLSSITKTGSNGVGNIGAVGSYFNTVFAKATSAQYADLAEMYVADANYQPGTVLEFGGTHEVTATTESHSTRVAGIVSTNPSYLMNSCQEGEYVVAVALTGRVPCRVQGPVRKGDVLVSSETPGVAQRIGVNWQPGCTVGKAMEVIETNTIQIIEVAVGRL